MISFSISCWLSAISPFSGWSPLGFAASLCKEFALGKRLSRVRIGDRSCVPLVASGKAERSIPRSAINCFNALGFAASLVEEHPKMGHQPFHDSSSGAARALLACYQRDARKVIISSESPKWNAIYLLVLF